MLSVGDTLLILRTSTEAIDRSGETRQFPDSLHSGIYVCNTPSLGLLSHVSGEYWSIVEVSNARGTFAALQKNRVSFFELQEGKLVLVSTTTLSTKLFSRSLSAADFATKTIFGRLKSCWYPTSKSLCSMQPME